MANEDISKLPRWARMRLAVQADKIIELKKQIEELNGEFRTGTRVLRGGYAGGPDIAVGDQDDRFEFYTRFYDPDNHLGGGKIEVHIDRTTGGLSVRSNDTLFVRPSASNSIVVFDARHNALQKDN